MLLSQDVIRRDILHTNDGKDSTAVDLLKELVLFGKKHSGIIVLEGILNSSWYKPLFDNIQNSFDYIYTYYYDLPLKKPSKDFKPKQYNLYHARYETLV